MITKNDIEIVERTIDSALMEITTQIASLKLAIDSDINVKDYGYFADTVTAFEKGVDELDFGLDRMNADLEKLETLRETEKTSNGK